MLLRGMRRALQNSMLGFYRTASSRGLMRRAWGRRLFFIAYDLYKNMLEAGPIEALRAYVPVGALVIDVGANVGFFTERFARWVGESGRVVAIEPEPVNFAELTRRLAVRGLADRVDMRRAVADASSGRAHLVVNAGHPGDHRMGAEGLPVTAITLDKLPTAGRRASLIKIDVQGAEKRVLEGALALIARDHPALFIELEPVGLGQFGTDVGDLLDFLGRLGYAPYKLVRTGAEPCSRADIGAAIAQDGYTDLLFRPAPA